MGASGRLKKKIQKNASENGNEESMDMTLGAQMADPEQKQNVDQGKVRQVEDIVAMFMTLIHGEQTREATMNMLKAEPDPTKSIPQTANNLMMRVEQQTKKRRQKLPDDAKIAAAQYMVPDLAMLGNKAQIWDRPVAEEDLPQLLQDTMQMYIRRGLANKTIDPVKLQRDVEKLMTPEQKQTAMQFGGEEVPREPTPAMAVEQKVDEAVSKERAKTEQARAQAEALKGNIRNNAAGNPDRGAALQGRQ